MRLSSEQLIDLVLKSFEAERLGNIAENSQILHQDFKMTDMVIGKDKKYFPSLSGDKLHDAIKLAFTIKGRKFKFSTVIADEATQTVIVEFIESYPDTETGKEYRTPQVAICQIRDGKLYRTRHYMDPRLSYEHLSESVIEEAIS